MSPARVQAGHDRCASEVAEHLCNGERVWIARGTDVGTTWTIGKDPVTLLEVLDHLPGAHYDWVIKQTMTALNNSAPTTEHDTAQPRANPNPDETLILGEIHQLMLEVLRLAHASDALEAHLPLNLRPDEQATLKLRDRAWIQLAS